MFRTIAPCLCLILVIGTVVCDESMCTKRVRRTYNDIQRHPVTYIETYKETCRLIFTCKRTRINSYNSYSTVQREIYVNVQECCDGYQPNRKGCAPVCMRPCSNGYCSKPNVCACDAGYRPTKDPNVCEPVCLWVNCTNGKCIRPNECECNFGYQKSATGGCDPICTEPCINATCSSPDTCVCLPGFRNANDSNECAPYCSTGCDNGVCIAPDICWCEKGYAFRDGKCQPVCDACSNGRCVKPGVCQCNDLFQKDSNGTCVPYCEHCDNGSCTSPGHCECYEGFVKDVNGLCAPNCTNGCENGVCTSPNICSCNQGYRNLSGQCVPQCEKCENGVCSSPNECKCLKGYEFATNATNHCIPTCTPKCSNGHCTAPNECSCDPGYKLDKGNCVPNCSSCSHGKCTAPEVCSCLKGYKHPANAIDRCIPICQQGCVNGTCIKPDKCVCSKGFKVLRGTCYPYCSRCMNGDCVAPGECVCLDGYRYQLNSKFICEAVCSSGCEHGNCIEPDICMCDKGYLLDEKTGRCEPRCEVCARNSICVAPDKCECLAGYKSVDGACVPSCDYGCLNGTECRLGCVNGTCWEPASCSCSCGFALKVLEDNNTYCVYSEEQDVKCFTQIEDPGDRMGLHTSTDGKRNSRNWWLTGVALAATSVLVVFVILQRRKLRRLATTSFYRYSTRSGSEHIYESPERASER